MLETVDNFFIATIGRSLTELHRNLKHTDHMVLSYLGIRRAVGSLGLALPVVLAAGGFLLFGTPIQENISSYYHTPLRDVFVGVMCAIGLFLYCYRGSSRFENWTGNLGCIAAVGVAFFPLDAGSDPLRQTSIAGYLHSLCGGAFFLTLAVFSVYYFPLNEPEDDAPDFLLEKSTSYRLSGITILASVLVMGVYLFLLPQATKDLLDKYCFLFWMESIAVWSFAVAWLVKGRAIALLTEGVEKVRELRHRERKKLN